MKTQSKDDGLATSVADRLADRIKALRVLSRFRTGLYSCLVSRPDALFELGDALLCTDRPVKSLVDLTLLPEHRRGHGGMYDALNHGGIDRGGPVTDGVGWAAIAPVRRPPSGTGVGCEPVAAPGCRM